MAENRVTIKDIYSLQEKMDEKLNNLENKVDSRFVTKDEFELYKKLIQAMAFAFVTSLVGAFIWLIQRAGQL